VISMLILLKPIYILVDSLALLFICTWLRP